MLSISVLFQFVVYILLENHGLPLLPPQGCCRQLMICWHCDLQLAGGKRVIFLSLIWWLQIFLIWCLQEDPLYAQYERLCCGLVPVEADSEEFSMVWNCYPIFKHSEIRVSLLFFLLEIVFLRIFCVSQHTSSKTYRKYQQHGLFVLTSAIWMHVCMSLPHLWQAFGGTILYDWCLLWVVRVCVDGQTCIPLFPLNERLGYCMFHVQRFQLWCCVFEHLSVCFPEEWLREIT